DEVANWMSVRIAPAALAHAGRAPRDLVVEAVDHATDVIHAVVVLTLGRRQRDFSRFGEVALAFLRPTFTRLFGRPVAAVPAALRSLELAISGNDDAAGPRVEVDQLAHVVCPICVSTARGSAVPN